MQSLKRFPIMLLFLIAMDIFFWNFMRHETATGVQTSWLAVFWVLAVSLTLLAIFWFCFLPKTARGAKLLRRFNWMFLAVWAVALIFMAVKQPSIDLVCLAAVYTFLLLWTAGYNKILFAQEFPQSDTAIELSMPYYLTKHQVDMLKTFAIGFPIGIACILALLAGFGTDTPWYYGAMFGFCVGLFLSCWLLPSLFVKQTAHPSFAQRFCRSYTLWLILSLLASNFRKASLPAQLALTKLQQLVPQKYNFLPDRDYYKFWLSHPGVEITPELCKQIDELDLETFDWQDPTQWPILEEDNHAQ